MLKVLDAAIEMVDLRLQMGYLVIGLPIGNLELVGAEAASMRTCCENICDKLFENLFKGATSLHCVGMRNAVVFRGLVGDDETRRANQSRLDDGGFAHV